MVDNAEKGKVDFIKFEERHVCFGNIYIDKNGYKTPKKTQNMSRGRGGKKKGVGEFTRGELELRWEYSKASSRALGNKPLQASKAQGHTWRWQGTDRALWQQDKHTKIHTQQGPGSSWQPRQGLAWL